MIVTAEIFKTFSFIIRNESNVLIVLAFEFIFPTSAKKK